MDYEYQKFNTFITIRWSEPNLTSRHDSWAYSKDIGSIVQEMVQNVQEMSRRSRKCVMGLWTFVWRSMKCVNRYRKWLQSSGVVWAKPIPTGSHVVATTTLVSIQLANCVWGSQGLKRSKTKLSGSRNWMHMRKTFYCSSSPLAKPQISFGIHPTWFCSSRNLARAARGAAHTICTSDGD